MNRRQSNKQGLFQVCSRERLCGHDIRVRGFVRGFLQLERDGRAGNRCRRQNAEHHPMSVQVGRGLICDKIEHIRRDRGFGLCLFTKHHLLINDHFLLLKKS